MSFTQMLAFINNMKTIIYITLIIGLLQSKSMACGCIGTGELDKKEFKKYDLVISGTVIRLEDDGFNTIIVLKLDKIYKSKVESKELKVLTPKGSCELGAKINENWLIFAYRRKQFFTTDVCTRSKILDTDSLYYKEKEVDSDLKFLRKK